MLKKASRKNDVVDVSADNPVGTLDRFTDGLRRVLSTTAKARTKPKLKKPISKT